MSRYDSVVVGAELVSEHYLGEEFGGRVRQLRADWAELEQHGKTTPRSGLAGLSGAVSAALVRIREAGADTSRQRSDAALRALYATVRTALGLDGDVVRYALERAGTDLVVEAVVHETAAGAHLLVLEAADAVSVEDVLDADGAGRLLDAVCTPDGTPVEVTTVRAVSTVFLATHPTPPALVAVQAGGWLLVAERTRWAEGRWLAVDLLTATDRHDTRAGGELETVAALVGGQALLPADDGSCGFLGMLEASVTHAVGVSKDLREGVRESIEVVAAQVLQRRRERGLPDDDVDVRSLQTQALRYLYRIIFLLYAEARPELGVLPVGAPEYAAGYGLDRLRDLTLTELTSARAQTGTHLFDSLAVLFRLVDGGHDGGDDGLRFERLRADLFSPRATPLVDEVGLGNAALQRVLRRLLLSRARAGRDRGFVSYAQLGINQLGAVYEGLMAYTAFLAPEPLVEVARDGDSEKGSWLVPQRSFEGSGIAREHLVRRDDAVTGEPRMVRYATGDVVLRLAGRDRQRSASYYTPQVLTACVVRHCLAELPAVAATASAAEVLRLRICEPALGSGAFLVEALDQLAAVYLAKAQAELGRTIDPEDMPAQTQRVKAYLALHCCYGVDLNATAVELAEISLWLASMHPGLRGPWFGLRLRRGNSLIGARRAVYSPAEYAKALWLKTVPTDRALGAGDREQPVAAGEVHHFLLPAAGWGAVADTAEARELRPDETAALKEWRKAVRRPPTPADRKRLVALAQRVERLWALAGTRLTMAEAHSRRAIDVWGLAELGLAEPGPAEPGPAELGLAAPQVDGAVTREQIEEFLADEGNAYRRLRRVMDAWCALWFWPVHGDVEPPTWAQWLGALEGLLGIAAAAAKPAAPGQDDLFSATWQDLADTEHNALYVFATTRPVAEVLAEHPWLDVCAGIAEKEGFFHWELDFAPVFAQGGFDLQVGNPPWVRPDWDDALVLSEADPWFCLAVKPSVAAVTARRSALLAYERYANPYLAERASLAGLSEHLGSEVDRPLLAGLRPDLYRCFMERTWRSMAPHGIVGLIHPESHFTEARAGSFRQATYERLRRHWQFRNERRMFEIQNTREYGVSIYGNPQPVWFQSASSLYEPQTIDRSLAHDGSGGEPGIKDDGDQWDVRPHRRRIIHVDDRTLAEWAVLIDDPGTPPRHARLLRPVNSASQAVLTKLASAQRFSSVDFRWTSGWNEKTDRSAGYFIAESAVPATWDQTILQGPHFTVANPLSQQANPTMRSPKDYTPWDLETLPPDAIPRTSYQPATPMPEYTAGYPRWEGKSSADVFRLAWRRMLDSSTERTVHAALVPPGPTHVDAVHTLSAAARDVVMAAGMWSSIVVDFLVKVSGAGKLNAELASRFPHPADSPLVPEVLLRALRLNCLTAAYAPLWAELHPDLSPTDAWTATPTPTTRDHARSGQWQPAPLADVGPQWSVDTPLRRDWERRQALVELDALAAVMLDITAEELCAIYRTQFGVLRKYERANRYDANGRKVPPDVVKAYEAWQERGGRAPDLGRYEPPFVGYDREADLTRAHADFSRRLAPRSGR